MEHETILQMGFDRMLTRCAYHEPITVKFSDKSEWHNGFDLDNKRSLVWYTDRPRPIKALVLGYKEGD
jgi:hypothetical protein